MRRKHKKDGNHGKRGWVGGNPRYSRAKLKAHLAGKRTTFLSPQKVTTMGKN